MVNCAALGESRLILEHLLHKVLVMGKNIQNSKEIVGPACVYTLIRAQGHEEKLWVFVKLLSNYMLISAISRLPSPNARGPVLP